MRLYGLLVLSLTACTGGVNSSGGYSTTLKKPSVQKTPTASPSNTSDGVVLSTAKKSSLESYAPTKLFNVAILTQSVQCLFCHMKIEGDVGGIHFPDDAEMHKRSGESLRILGTLFATNNIPELLRDPKVAQKLSPVYRNTDLKIFPTTVDARGEPSFPQVKPEMLSGKVTGSIKLGSLSIQNSYSGDLTLVAANVPLEIDGEVFIDGNLIIGGNYRGLGTIYAKNIFIVQDLKATQSPFPFPSDPEQAKSHGKSAVESKKDGLYLLSLGQTTVGFPDPEFLRRRAEWRTVVSANENMTQFLPNLSLENYRSLSVFKSCNVDPKSRSTEYRSVLVNRVDAFLYASDYLLWRTCNGYELNGGFVAPNVAIVNAGDADNGAKEPLNVVRYDFRLRAGVKAFSVLKDFFEQD